MADGSTPPDTVQKDSRAPIRRRPPYARRTAHNTGRDARVIVGAVGWDLARQWDERGDWPHRLTAVLPLDADPAAIDWRDFAGREVLVAYYADADPVHVHQAAAELVQAGARMVLTVDHRGNREMDVYRAREAA
ncbi:MAG: hypothetical protein K9M02_14145 [Thiohalocapsa sp.]|nr:hypothetical protein [Thiohalocapsa sp.]